jgi:hypothetical protein
MAPRIQRKTGFLAVLAAAVVAASSVLAMSGATSSKDDAEAQPPAAQSAVSANTLVQPVVQDAPTTDQVSAGTHGSAAPDIQADGQAAVDYCASAIFDVYKGWGEGQALKTLAPGALWRGRTSTLLRYRGNQRGTGTGPLVRLALTGLDGLCQVTVSGQIPI